MRGIRASGSDFHRNNYKNETPPTARKINRTMRSSSSATKAPTIKYPKRARPARAHIGDFVCLRYQTEIQCYTLVEKYSSKKSLQQLSTTSPLGAATLGRQVGDTIFVKSQLGNFRFTLTSIE